MCGLRQRTERTVRVRGREGGTDGENGRIEEVGWRTEWRGEEEWKMFLTGRDDLFCVVNRIHNNHHVTLNIMSHSILMISFNTGLDTINYDRKKLWTMQHRTSMGTCKSFVWWDEPAQSCLRRTTWFAMKCNALITGFIPQTFTHLW
jgi:hypothetical protein